MFDVVWACSASQSVANLRWDFEPSLFTPQFVTRHSEGTAVCIATPGKFRDPDQELQRGELPEDLQ